MTARRQRGGGSPFGRAPALPCLLLLILAGCGGEPPVREELHVFGTGAEIEVRGVPRAQAEAAIAEVAQRLAEYHRDWHAWQPSALTALNAAFAEGRPAPAPASLRALIARAQPLSVASDGLLDPAVGGLIELWGFHTSDYPVTSPPPSAAAVAAWRATRPRITDVVIDGESVHSRNPEVQLDFGALAEGVAAETAARTLAEHGIADALLNLGGDVLALGTADGRPWRVGLRDPFGGVLAGAELRGHEALFSSGNYNKFRSAPGGGRWPHILDPRTGYPVLGVAAVAVLHPDPVRADAASTALFVAGPARFVELVERMELACALLLTEENELLITAGMRARLTFQRDPVPLGPPLDRGLDCSAKG